MICGIMRRDFSIRINIKNCNPTLAAMIISQYGGPDGELGASMRYLSQRYSMPYREVAGLLTDIGTEELGHLEMVSTMVHQLTRNLTMEQIKGLRLRHIMLIIRLEYGRRCRRCTFLRN
mgnify:CR=1 FL=1